MNFKKIDGYWVGSYQINEDQIENYKELSNIMQKVFGFSIEVDTDNNNASVKIPAKTDNLEKLFTIYKSVLGRYKIESILKSLKEEGISMHVGDSENVAYQKLRINENYFERKQLLKSLMGIHYVNTEYHANVPYGLRVNFKYIHFLEMTNEELEVEVEKLRIEKEEKEGIRKEQEKQRKAENIVEWRNILQNYRLTLEDELNRIDKVDMKNYDNLKNAIYEPRLYFEDQDC